MNGEGLQGPSGVEGAVEEREKRQGWGWEKGCLSGGGVASRHGVTREDLTGQEAWEKPVLDSLILDSLIHSSKCAAVSRERQPRGPLQSLPGTHWGCLSSHGESREKQGTRPQVE